MNRPAGRYDEPKRSSRVAVVAVAALLALGLLGGGYALYTRHNAGRVGFEVRGYQVVSNTAVRVTFDVRLKRGQRGECKVRARDRTGVEAGSAIVPVGPADRDGLTTTYELTTGSRATAGEVVGCRRL